MSFSMLALKLGAAFMSLHAPAAEQLATQPIIEARFAQSNPLWSGYHFFPNKTFGEKGCAVFALYIIASINGYTGDPRAFAQRLRFDNDGDVFWDSFERTAPLVAVRRHESGQAAYDVMVSALENGDYAVLRIRTARGTWHWIAAIGLEGRHIITIDPATGRRGVFRRFHRIESINGLALIRRTTQPVRIAAAS